MKKTFTVILSLVLLVTAIFALTACGDKENAVLTVKKYEITESKVNIGDVHTPSSVKITATMSDDTTKAVANNLVYDEADVKALLLDADNKYTKAGEYFVKVYILEAQNKFLLGEWKITVKVTK